MFPSNIKSEKNILTDHLRVHLDAIKNFYNLIPSNEKCKMNFENLKKDNIYFEVSWKIFHQTISNITVEKNDNFMLDVKNAYRTFLNTTKALNLDKKNYDNFISTINNGFRLLTFSVLKNKRIITEQQNSIQNTAELAKYNNYLKEIAQGEYKKVTESPEEIIAKKAIGTYHGIRQIIAHQTYSVYNGAFSSEQNKVLEEHIDKYTMYTIRRKLEKNSAEKDHKYTPTINEIKKINDIDGILRDYKTVLLEGHDHFNGVFASKELRFEVPKIPDNPSKIVGINYSLPICESNEVLTGQADEMMFLCMDFDLYYIGRGSDYILEMGKDTVLANKYDLFLVSDQQRTGLKEEDVDQIKAAEKQTKNMSILSFTAGVIRNPNPDENNPIWPGYKTSDMKAFQEQVSNLRRQGIPAVCNKIDFCGAEREDTIETYGKFLEPFSYKITRFNEDLRGITELRIHTGELALPDIGKKNVENFFDAFKIWKERLEKEGAKTDIIAIRIGHGTQIGIKQILQMIKYNEEKNGIKFYQEACLSSNKYTAVLNKRGDYPLGMLLLLGVKIVLGSDGGNIYNTTLSAEWKHANNHILRFLDKMFHKNEENKEIALTNGDKLTFGDLAQAGFVLINDEKPDQVVKYGDLKNYYKEVFKRVNLGVIIRNQNELSKNIVNSLPEGDIEGFELEGYGVDFRQLLRRSRDLLAINYKDNFAREIIIVNNQKLTFEHLVEAGIYTKGELESKKLSKYRRVTNKDLNDLEEVRLPKEQKFITINPVRTKRNFDDIKKNAIQKINSFDKKAENILDGLSKISLYPNKKRMTDDSSYMSNKNLYCSADDAKIKKLTLVNKMNAMRKINEWPIIDQSLENKDQKDQSDSYKNFSSNNCSNLSQSRYPQNLNNIFCITGKTDVHFDTYMIGNVHLLLMPYAKNYYSIAQAYLDGNDVVNNIEKVIKALKEKYPNKPIYMFEHGTGTIDGNMVITATSLSVVHAHWHFIIGPDTSSPTFQQVSTITDMLLEKSNWPRRENNKIGQELCMDNISELFVRIQNNISNGKDCYPYLVFSEIRNEKISTKLIIKGPEQQHLEVPSQFFRRILNNFFKRNNPESGNTDEYNWKTLVTKIKIGNISGCYPKFYSTSSADSGEYLSKQQSKYLMENQKNIRDFYKLFDDDFVNVEKTTIKNQLRHRI